MSTGWVLVVLAAVFGFGALFHGLKGEDPKQIWREFGLAVATGAMVGAVMIPIQSELEDRRSDREQEREDERLASQIRLSNLTFLREAIASDSRLWFDNLDLSELPLNNLDLRQASFLGADLSGADLRDSDIEGADFQGALISGAIFGYADNVRERNNPNYEPPSGSFGGGSSWAVTNFEDAWFGNVCWVEDDPPIWQVDTMPPESADWCR